MDCNILQLWWHLICVWWMQAKVALLLSRQVRLISPFSSLLTLFVNIQTISHWDNCVVQPGSNKNNILREKRTCTVYLWVMENQTKLLFAEWLSVWFKESISLWFYKFSTPSLDCHFCDLSFKSSLCEAFSDWILPHRMDVQPLPSQVCASSYKLLNALIDFHISKMTHT